MSQEEQYRVILRRNTSGPPSTLNGHLINQLTIGTKLFILYDNHPSKILGKC